MKHKKSVIATLSLISQLGVSMVVPIFICIFIGMKLKLTIPFIILGVLAGVRNVYVLVKHATDTMNSEKDEDDL